MTKMCDQIQPHLEAFVDGELGWWMAWRVRRHLAGCGACASELAELQQIGRRARAWRNIPAPSGLQSRIAAALPPAAPLAVRQPFPARRTAVGLAGMGVAAAAFFWLLPGQPGRPIIAFADVQRAVQQAQTVSYDMNTQIFDAQGRVFDGGTSFSESIWLRRIPPASAYLDHKMSERYLFDHRGKLGYDLKKGSYWKGPLPARLDVAKEIDWQLRSVTEPPTNEAWPPSDPSQHWTISPWQQQKVTVNGSACWKFTRTISRTLGNRHGVTHINILVDAKTLHITSIKIVGDAMFMSKGYQERAVFSNFHYNETPPPGIFDWLPPPGAKVRGHW